MKIVLTIFAMFWMFIIAQTITMCFQSHETEFRVIERDGVYIVQSNCPFGLIPDWDDEKYFHFKENAEKYMGDWRERKRLLSEIQFED